MAEYIIEATDEGLIGRTIDNQTIKITTEVARTFGLKAGDKFSVEYKKRGKKLLHGKVTSVTNPGPRQKIRVLRAGLRAFRHSRCG